MCAAELSKMPSSSYLFQVEVLVNADTNGEALEKLLHALNAGHFADYRVTSGIKLGQAIEAMMQQAGAASAQKNAPASAVQPKISAALAKAKQEATATAATGTAQTKKKAEAKFVLSDELQARIQSYIDTNKLIRLNVNKGRGVKLSIPCRIISLDPDRQLLTVYHVDEKQVHSLKLFEIDDFIE